MKSLLGACAAAVILGVAAFFLAVTPVRAEECWHWVASWYGTESGNRTANGEPFDGTSLTAAHKTLPFGTKPEGDLPGPRGGGADQRSRTLHPRPPARPLRSRRPPHRAHPGGQWGG